MPTTAYQYHEFRAMGGQIELWLDIDNKFKATLAFERAEAVFRQVEQALSRFDSCSELSQLNQNPDQWVTVSPLLWDVLRLALAYADETGGVFDPTISLALQHAGYDRTFDEIIGDSTLQAFTLSGTYQQVLTNNRRVFVPQGIELDLGGIAKGYTVQQIAGMLAELGPALVNGSGDIMAMGQPRGYPGWLVGIEFPEGGEHLAQTLAVVWLYDQGLATSGVDRRRWGVSSHHIINPFTQQSVDTSVITASVIAADLVDADVYATVSLIAGADGVPQEFGLLTCGAQNSIYMNQKMRDVLVWLSPHIKLTYKE